MRLGDPPIQDKMYPEAKGVLSTLWTLWLQRLSQYFGVPPNYTYFESDGTMVASGDATTWVDINFPINQKTIGAGTPNYNTVQGNIKMLQWAVNDSQQLDQMEFIHSWKQGTPVTWHIHMITGGTDASDRYVQWSIEYTWANFGSTLPGNTTTASGDLKIPANTPAYTHFIFNIGTWTPTNGLIGAHVMAVIKRIAASGTAPTANPFSGMVQLHIEQDTTGSRQITSK